MATLTGAARVALGPQVMPFYTHDDGFASELAEAASRVGDPLWRMPLWEGYRSMLSSKIADVNHISTGGFAGSITAALVPRPVRGESRVVGAFRYLRLGSERPAARAGGRRSAGDPRALRPYRTDMARGMSGPASGLDRRLHAFRQDLADERLRGTVEADRFVAGRPVSIRLPVVDLKPRPSTGAGMDTQMLMGDRALVFEQRDGWAWIQAERDGYVGYVPTSAIRFGYDDMTHRVNAPRTFLYGQPDMKTPVLDVLSMGCGLRVTGEKTVRGTIYAALAGGRFVVSQHMCAVGDIASDYVAVAEKLIGAPYLWGGASAFGVDCSGIISLAMRMTGRAVPRDSDMQADALGTPVTRNDLQRGDLVFWKGHVGIMADEATLLHANGHTMDVAREPLEDAIRRIGYLYGQPTVYRRP